MTYSKKSRRSILEDALLFIRSGGSLLMRIKKDPSYMPEEHDFKLVQKIYEEGHRIRIKATYIEALMHQRLKGEQAIEPTWDDDEFDKE